ncbi:MAG TPA: hypothetical protein HA362_00050 [Nanoarchaeota archaeon]|nr:hypothetical protein [Nanoarchaeota archaeon]
MGKIFLFLLISLVFCSASAFAANITVSVRGDSLFAGQTVQADVAMDRFEISKLALRDAAGGRVPVGFFRYAYGEGNYMVYFSLPAQMQLGNYSFSASDRIMEDGVLKDINATALFKVSSGQSVFSIAPAIIKLASQQSVFRIDLRHVYGDAADAAVSVTDNALKPVRASIAVAPGETKTLYVNYDYSKIKGDAVLKLSAGALVYEIPVISGKANASEAVPNQTGMPNATTPVDALETVGQLTVIRHKVPRDRIIAGGLKIRNAYSKPLHNLTFSSSGVPGVELNVTELLALGPNETYTQYIWINRLKNATAGNYTGAVAVNSAEGASLDVKLEIEFQDILEEQNQTLPVLNNTALIPNQASSKDTVTVEPVDTQINLTFNFTEIQQANEEDQQRSLWIAVALILAVLLIIALLAYKLRPKVKYKQMKEYTQELGSESRQR